MTAPPTPPPTPPPGPPWWLTILQAWKIWVPILAALFALGGITLTVTDDNGDNIPEHIHLDRDFKQLPAATPPAAPVIADADNQLEPDEQAEARKSQPDLAGNMDLHEDTRDETPPGVSPAEIVAGQQATNALAQAEGIHPPEPVGGAQIFSCPNHLVRNRSSLTAKRVGTALHFTVSAPGSGPAIIRLFDTPSFGASSNKLIELSGKCWTLVPDSQKAWAQLTANSAYFSIEIVTNDLTRAQWLAAPIIKNGILAALVRDLNQSIGAPLRLVDPVGCVFNPGVTDHSRLECGTTHWDVGKNFPWSTFMRQVRAAPCDAKCKRTRTLKRRLARAQVTIRAENCRPLGEATRQVCVSARQAERDIRQAAATEHIDL